MKKLMMGCCAAGVAMAIAGCSSTVSEGQKETGKKPLVSVTNNYYVIVVPEEAMKADHRKQRGKGNGFSGGPRHRDDPSRKVPGDPGANRR